MSDFKFYPPGLEDSGSQERNFYPDVAHSTVNISKNNEREPERKPLAKTRPADAATSNTALNHRISMCSVVFGYIDDELMVLLLESDQAEAKDQKARLELPGGLATENQTLESSARQLVQQLSGQESFYMEQVYSFGNPGKSLNIELVNDNDTSPPTWEITVAFFALLNAETTNINQVSQSKSAGWYSLKQIKHLSPYQNQIVAKALATLQFEIRYFPIAFELLPEKFTMAQVQSIYEAISGKKLDKRNFQKKVKALRLIRPSGQKQRNMVARPSQLFVFNRDAYDDSHNSIL